jgi:DNA polymerase III delta prime subunit
MADSPDSSELTPAIWQDVTGNRNQLIDQVSGGIVINQLTIHERVPSAVVLPHVAAAPPLTQQEYRQRQVLLSKVKDYWVKGVLKTSLHTRAMIELGLHERPDMVQRPFQDVAEFPDIAEQALPDGTSANTTFDQMGQGRTLLILGEPGSGKTNTLLKLAQDLIARTEQDLSQPIPVVFNLSSWARKSQSIETWLVQELLEKYQVSKVLGEKSVETENLILLLDGLDEVKAEHRNACVQALNQFIQTHGTTELIICCRIQDYQALADRLMLRSAICIQPLTLDQIDQYFDQAGEQLESLKEVLCQDKTLQALATSPLMLSIMSLAYQNSTPREVSQSITTVNYRQNLFDTYIERMLQRRSTVFYYSREQTVSWLAWLAQKLKQESKTVFLVEKINPNYASNKTQKIIYAILHGLFMGASMFLITSTIVGASKALIVFFSVSILAGFTWGIHNQQIQSTETLQWSTSNLKRHFAPLTIAFTFLSLLGSLIIGFFGGLILSIVVYSIALVLFGLSGGQIEESTKVNQGIWQSLNNGFLFSAIGAGGMVIFSITTNMPLLESALLGSIFGLLQGFPGCIQHFSLRLIFHFNRYSPWNYAHFLDYATDRLFL